MLNEQVSALIQKKHSSKKNLSIFYFFQIVKIGLYKWDIIFGCLVLELFH